MSNSNQKSKSFLVFPENSASIITNILKKYGLKESNKELLEKWRKGQKGFGAILADLIIETSKTKSSLSELTDLIQKKLNTNRQKSQKIVDDLNKEILIPATRVTEETSSERKLLSIGEQLFPDKIIKNRKDQKT